MLTYNVYEWPKRWRQAFVLLLPLSGPLWLLVVAVMMLAMILLLLVVLTPVSFLAGVWNGKSYFEE